MNHGGWQLDPTTGLVVCDTSWWVRSWRQGDPGLPGFPPSGPSRPSELVLAEASLPAPVCWQIFVASSLGPGSNLTFRIDTGAPQGSGDFFGPVTGGPFIGTGSPTPATSVRITCLNPTGFQTDEVVVCGATPTVWPWWACPKDARPRAALNR